MMSHLTDEMKNMLKANTFGFVATVCPDNTPNLSPKGTCVVIDDNHIAFSNLRSPTTVSNITSNPAMEVNFSDLFARKAFRAKGTAEYFEKGTSGFKDLLPHFQVWEDLIPMMDGIVKLKIGSAKLILSPSYDIGLTEEGLREHWKKHYLQNA